MDLLATRHDLAYSICLVAMYTERSTKTYLVATQRILRYLKGTTNLGIMYKMNDEAIMHGWSDSDFAGDNDDIKSTPRYVFKLGSCLISWSSKKQLIVTLSRTAVEFDAETSLVCQGLWLRSIL